MRAQGWWSSSSRTLTAFAEQGPVPLSRASLGLGQNALCRNDMLRRVTDRVGEMAREETLHGHDVGAETAAMEMIALAGPLIPVERDAMRAVVATKSDVEVLEGHPLGLFGVALRLLDLGDEARVHPTPPPLRVIRLAPVTAILCSLFARTILGRVSERNSPVSRLTSEVVAEHARFLEFFDSYERRAPTALADFVAGNPQEM